MSVKKFISEASRNIETSKILKLLIKAQGKKDAVFLNIGEPDFQAPSSAVEGSLEAFSKGRTRYCPSRGIFELRKNISEYLEKRYELGYNPETQIAITAGASQAIDFAFRVLLNPGDEVIIPQPGFELYKSCVLSMHAVPVVLNLTESKEFKLTPELLEATITPKTKAILINYPNNPTGAVMTKEELAKLVEVLKRKDVIVIVDDIYSEYTYGSRHVSLAEFEEIRDKVLLVSGFSKSFAMTGWRIGYVCGHEDLITEIEKTLQYALICTSPITQYAAKKVLDDYNFDEWDLLLDKYDKRRRVTLEYFRKLGFNCFEPLGAFYVFPSIKHINMPSYQFCERLMEEEGVCITPGSAFGDGGEGYIRVCYASADENVIKLAADRVARFIEKLGKERQF